MRVIMFDRQSIFIHGAIHGLQKLIPEINITGACQADDFMDANIRVTVCYRHD